MTDGAGAPPVTGAAGYCRLMAAYNRWMNRRLYDAAARLDDAERKRDRGAFFGSIHGTLNHLLVADRLWLGRFRGEPYRPPSLDHELHAELADLRREREAVDDAIVELVDGLSAERLGGWLAYETFLAPPGADGPVRKEIGLLAALVHFFNHQTHHRGQVTDLLVQAGVDPGITDLLYLPEAGLRDPRPGPG